MYFSDAFHKQPAEIELSLACVIEFNTHIRGDIPAPILYGVGKFIIFTISLHQRCFSSDLPYTCSRELFGVNLKAHIHQAREML